MRITFSKNYSKLKNDTLTTIRKVSKRHKVGAVFELYLKTSGVLYFNKKDKQTRINETYIMTAKVVDVKTILPMNITEELAKSDADMSLADLLKMFLKWGIRADTQLNILTLERIINNEI